MQALLERQIIGYTVCNNEYTYKIGASILVWQKCYSDSKDQFFHRAGDAHLQEWTGRRWDSKRLRFPLGKVTVLILLALQWVTLSLLPILVTLRSLVLIFGRIFGKMSYVPVIVLTPVVLEGCSILIFAHGCDETSLSMKQRSAIGNSRSFQAWCVKLPDCASLKLSHFASLWERPKITSGFPQHSSRLC